MSDTGRQYHIHLAPGEIGEYVLLPGDPARCDIVAQYLDDAKKMAEHREHRTFTGHYKGVKTSVTSTGMGCPSTAIACEELINIGAEYLIRIGSTGVYQPQIKKGDLLISTGSVREEGTSSYYLPPNFPAVPDFDFTRALIDTAADMQAELGCNYHYGINVSCDAFYRCGPDFTKKMHDLGVHGAEMESAAIYAVCHVRGKHGAMIAAASAENWRQLETEAVPDSDGANIQKYELDNPALKKGWDDEIRVVLETIYRFEQRRKQGD